jgi:hypothetical protein
VNQADDLNAFSAFYQSVLTTARLLPAYRHLTRGLRGAGRTTMGRTRMGRNSFRFAAVLAVVCVPAADALAQRVSTINCTPSMAAMISVNGNGDRNGEQDTGGADASVTLEAPVANGWSARGEGGAVAWTFQRKDALTDAVIQQERVRLGRVTISAVHRPPGCGSPVRPYTGFGIGVYRYRFPDQRVTVATGGIHGIFGVDVMRWERFGISAEVAVHAINGPRRSPVFSTVLWNIRAGVGARLRF